MNALPRLHTNKTHKSSHPQGSIKAIRESRRPRNNLLHSVLRLGLGGLLYKVLLIMCFFFIVSLMLGLFVLVVLAFWGRNASRGGSRHSSSQSPNANAIMTITSAPSRVHIAVSIFVAP